VVQLLLVPLFALMQGVVEPPYQASSGQVGVEYKFAVPVSNPDNIKLSFKKVAGELAPGISVQETGFLQGVPTAAGTATFTIAVLWNNIELSRHDYSLKIIPSKVQLLDPKVTPVKLLPTSTGTGTFDGTDEIHRGEETRVVLGFQQAGAAGADSDQKFFFDFYINRPLPWKDNRQVDPDSRVSWWGNVRIASAPRQINSPVSIQAITSSGKGLKVNELAQSAEFLTGLDFRLGQFLNPMWSQSSNTKMRSALFFTVGGGATGLLKADASSSYPVYQLNSADADYARLVQRYPQAANYSYISFIPPARNQYDTEYFAGFKLVTHYVAGPSAMVSFTVGQNELVSGGELRGAVGRVEAFFPLSTGQSGLFSAIYLFGNAQFRLHGPQNLQPYNFMPVTIVPAISTTLYVATPSNRDVYSIGLGLDLVKVLGALNISVKTGK
jgi:hypothetical protein